MSESFFMDDRTLALEHTLLTLLCDGPRFTVPARFGDCSVTTVGSGALQISNVEELRIAPGYTVLHEGCLCYTAVLRKLYIPESVQTLSPTLFISKFYQFNPELYIARALHPDVFRDIRLAALPLDEKRILIPPALLMRNGMAPVYALACNVAVSPAVIGREMRILFSGQLPNDASRSIYSGTIFDSRPCYDFLSIRKQTEEYTAVMEMIRDGDSGWHDPEAERLSDLDILFEKPIIGNGTVPEVAVVLCEKFSNGPGLDNRFHVQFHAFKQFLFFPSLQQIRHRGSDWWIYCRNYLTGDPKRPYMREDVGVFDRNGLITDRKTSEDVYAKCRFLSLL